LFLLMLLACDWIKFNQLDPATIYEAQNAGWTFGLGSGLVTTKKSS
jgi:hypothetical protein